MDNVELVKQKISTAAQKAGKAFDDITVVCATKTRDIETVKKIKDWGFHIAGENRVQELTEKYQPIEGISWQIVGQLQTNKVKYIADKVDMIQSLDRESLAAEIDRQCKKIGKVMPVLVEVNISEIEGRGGVMYDEAVDFANLVAEKYKNMKVEGFMTVLPICDSDEERSVFCKKMKTLFDKAKKLCQTCDIKFLSMGMSDDYEVAVENGANMIRLGRCLFGERH